MPTRMDSYLPCFLAFLLLLLASGEGYDPSYDQNYYITWGNDQVHFLSLNQGREVQLSMDKASGAGFGSKLKFGSGFAHLRIKVPGKDSGGVVTAFYLISQEDNRRDELDFEFLGNREGKPIILQTNVWVNGVGNREQRIRLWFDPSADFHDYKILWNPHQIVFYVDNIPIRVFKNKSAIGVSYPTQPMQIKVSLWDGSDWATDGGRTKVDWNHAPFRANFKGFDVSACAVQGSDIQPCYSPKYWWNANKHWQLPPNQQRAYERVKAKYLIDDYCANKRRFPTPPPECRQ